MSRKKQLEVFAEEVAKNKYTEDEMMEKLISMRPTFQELIFMDDLIQQLIEEDKKGEMKNER